METLSGAIVEKPTYAATNAVANAMMATQAYWLSPYIYLNQEPELPGKVIAKTDKVLKELSNRGCQDGSQIVIDYLAQKHQDLFSHIFLLVSYDKTYHPFTQFPKHTHVAYFVALDRNGFCHAGSSGNDNPDKVKNPLVTPVQASRNLKSVLDEIQGREGGRWPSAEYISTELFGESTKYRNPEKTDEKLEKLGPAEFGHRFFVIERDEAGGNHADMDYYPTINVDLMIDNPGIALAQRTFELQQRASVPVRRSLEILR